MRKGVFSWICVIFLGINIAYANVSNDQYTKVTARVTAYNKSTWVKTKILGKGDTYFVFTGDFYRLAVDPSTAYLAEGQFLKDSKRIRKLKIAIKKDSLITLWYLPSNCYQLVDFSEQDIQRICFIDHLEAGGTVLIQADEHHHIYNYDEIYKNVVPVLSGVTGAFILIGAVFFLLWLKKKYSLSFKTRCRSCSRLLAKNTLCKLQKIKDNDTNAFYCTQCLPKAMQTIFENYSAQAVLIKPDSGITKYQFFIFKEIEGQFRNFNIDYPALRNLFGNENQKCHRCEKLAHFMLLNMSRISHQADDPSFRHYLCGTCACQQFIRWLEDEKITLNELTLPSSLSGNGIGVSRFYSLGKVIDFLGGAGNR